MLFPFAAFFFVPFLVTVYWYRQAGSLPFLLVASLVHPVVTAGIFAMFVSWEGRLKFGEGGPEFMQSFVPTFLVFGVYAVVIAFPLSVLVSLAAAKKKEKEFDASDSQPQDSLAIKIIGIASVSSLFSAFAASSLLLYLSN
ncbi:hypothetical protein [Novipirellula rosea]|tara:strand:+ start:7299 stop:7721 length:423 start_codon:yes stop_codon:yes gene_type:complete